MTRLAEIQAHLQGMAELRDIVGAMRSLAGMRLQEALHGLPGIRRYTDSIGAAIADAMTLDAQPLEPRDIGSIPRAIVLFTSEHGFVGGYNERLIDAALENLRRTDVIFVLGGRGAAMLTERGRRAAWTYPLATRTAAAPETAQALSRALYTRVARGAIGRIEVIYARYAQGSRATIERRQVLPLDPRMLAPSGRKQPPLHTLAPGILVERLMAEHVFAALTAAAVESIASENAARLAAMESAHDNVSRRVEALRGDARQARQSEITAEILELVTAGKALEGGRSRPGGAAPGGASGSSA